MLGGLTAVAVLVGLVAAVLLNNREPDQPGDNVDRSDPGQHRVLSAITPDGRVHVQLRTYYDNPGRDAVFQQSLREQFGYAEGAFSVFVLQLTVRPPAGSRTPNDNDNENAADNQAAGSQPLQVGSLAVRLSVAADDTLGSPPAGGDVVGRLLPDLPSRPTSQGQLLADAFSPPVSIDGGHSAVLYVAFPGQVEFSRAVAASVTIPGYEPIALAAANEPYIVPPGLRDVGANRR